MHTPDVRASAGRSPPQAVARKVAIVVAVKLLAVLALFVAFFGPSHRPEVSPDTVRERLVEPVSSRDPGERP
ncbi:MAG TPA: hypothetical protein VLT59_14695 [Steroidobacteraceae bacterium]|nr:hypothetical protein [Steroidobacteraceae bacterium]